MAIPVADFLMDFRLDAPDTAKTNGPASVTVDIEDEPDDTAQRIQDAVRRAREEERHAARQTLEAALASEKASAEERLRQERNVWTREQAEVLSESLARGLRDLEERISDRMARLLVPFLGEALRTGALRELSEILEALISRGAGRPITIVGPEDLLLELKSAIDSRNENVEFLFGPGPDVRIAVDETIVETRLNAWVNRLSDAAGKD